MFSYVSPEGRVPRLHPLRAIREMTDRALQEMSPRFEQLYAKTGRPRSCPRNCSARSRCRCSSRSVVRACSWSNSTTTCSSAGSSDSTWMTRSGCRPCSARTATGCWKATSPKASSYSCLTQAKEGGLLSDEHFSVDGTLVEAWAGHKSFRKTTIHNLRLTRTRATDGELPRGKAFQ